MPYEIQRGKRLMGKSVFGRRSGIWLVVLVIHVPLLTVVASNAVRDGDKQRIYKIMPVGDSITEGGSNFVSYRYLLWEQLMAAGYLVEYTGSRISESRIGSLAHEGYGGKNAEFIASVVVTNFHAHPADIVLIHCGHNHAMEERPIPGIVDATESMITGLRQENSRVIVLLAQVIPSGKLPKYAYIPQLNVELRKLADRLNTPQQPVIIVDQAEGFDWRTDTIADGVHPNVQGAEKMASRWFSALTNVLEKPGQSFHPQIIPYKKAGGRELTLHVFTPPPGEVKSARPAIVFFFGGGWKNGTPLQFYSECAHFAARGLVAISADYRIESQDHTTPFESVADGKSAIRWVREHAAELGIDPDKIMAAGGSAGGQVAAAAGVVPGLEDAGEDLKVSSRPDEMILWSPVVDNGPGGYGYSLVKDRYREISPLHNMIRPPPPTLVFLGTKDPYIPVQTVQAFKARIEQAGGRCDLKLFEGAGHVLYEYRKGDAPNRRTTLGMADAFIESLRLTSQQTTNAVIRNN